MTSASSQAFYKFNAETSPGAINLLRAARLQMFGPLATWTFYKMTRPPLRCYKFVVRCGAPWPHEFLYNDPCRPFQVLHICCVRDVWEGGATWPHEFSMKWQARTPSGAINLLSGTRPEILETLRGMQPHTPPTWFPLLLRLRPYHHIERVVTAATVFSSVGMLLALLAAGVQKYGYSSPDPSVAMNLLCGVCSRCNMTST